MRAARLAGVISGLSSWRTRRFRVEGLGVSSVAILVALTSPALSAMRRYVLRQALADAVSAAADNNAAIVKRFFIYTPDETDQLFPGGGGRGIRRTTPIRLPDSPTLPRRGFLPRAFLSVSDPQGPNTYKSGLSPIRYRPGGCLVGFG